MEGWMQTWYAHGLPKQPDLTENEQKPSTDNRDINPDTRRINLTWRWMVAPTGETSTPPTGEAPAPTGENGDATKEAEDADMTDQADGEPIGNPSAPGAPTGPARAP